MRLIDADEFMQEILKMQKLNKECPLEKEYLEDKKVNNYDNGQQETFELIIEHLENHPTAFDLESVIAKSKENEQDMLKAIEENTPSGFYVVNAKDLKSMFVDYTKEQIEILNSASNATNGKIGG